MVVGHSDDRALGTGPRDGRGRGRRFEGHPRSQDCVLSKLPWSLGARLSRILSDTANCRTTNRVRRCERHWPGNFELSIPDPSAMLQGNLWPEESRSFKTAFPKPMLRHAPPVMARTLQVASKFRV